MFESEDFELRIQAVWRAQKLELEERLQLFRRQLESENHLHVVATLARALGSPGKSEDLPRLAELLKSTDDRVRSNTVEGIAPETSWRTCDQRSPPESAPWTSPSRLVSAPRATSKCCRLEAVCCRFVLVAWTWSS